MSATPVIEAPPTLWTECGDILWIRKDLAPTRGKARYMAWCGAAPVETPFANHERLIDLRVTSEWLRDTSTGAWNEWPWWPCAPSDEGAVAYWRVDVVDAPPSGVSS